MHLTYLDAILAILEDIPVKISRGSMSPKPSRKQAPRPPALISFSPPKQKYAPRSLIRHCNNHRIALRLGRIRRTRRESQCKQVKGGWVGKEITLSLVPALFPLTQLEAKFMTSHQALASSPCSLVRDEERLRTRLDNIIFNPHRKNT